MKRAFHVVYTALALNFIIPVMIYIFDPAGAVASFAQIGELVGGVTYAHSEDSVLWRVLGIANVATLGFCCVLLQVNLRRYFAALLPLVFLKSMASLGFLAAFAFEPNPSYLAACLFDALTVAAMWFFATRAHRTLRAASDAPRATPSTAVPA